MAGGVNMSNGLTDAVQSIQFDSEDLLKLITLNIFLIDHCNKRKYNCIDLARDLEGKNDYWWDGVHTTPKGSEAIANLIAPKLIEIFKKN